MIGEFHDFHRTQELLELQVKVFERLTKYFYLYYLRPNNYGRIVLADGYMIPATVEMGLIRKELLDQKCSKT